VSPFDLSSAFPSDADLFRQELERLIGPVRSELDRLGALKGRIQDLLERHRDLLPAQLFERSAQVEEQFAKVAQPEFRVALLGLLSAGKSSTANAIIEQDEFFPTGATRTTTTVTKKDWNMISIVDTPGLDSIETQEDEAKAREEATSADLVLFCLSDKAGDLDTVCLDWIKELARMEKDILFILNKKRDQ
jgi:predicted GTPase